MIKWIRTSRLSIKNSVSGENSPGARAAEDGLKVRLDDVRELGKGLRFEIWCSGFEI